MHYNILKVILWIVWLKPENICMKEMQKSRKIRNQLQKRLRTSFSDVVKTNDFVFRFC